MVGGLLPGEYMITTELDGTMPMSRTVRLHAKGCAEVRFFMSVDLR